MVSGASGDSVLATEPLAGTAPQQPAGATPARGIGLAVSEYNIRHFDSNESADKGKNQTLKQPPAQSSQEEGMMEYYDFGLAVKDWDDPAFLRLQAIKSQTRAADERRMRELGYEAYFDLTRATDGYRKILTPREKLERRVAEIERSIDWLLGNTGEPGGEWQGEAYMERFDVTPTYCKTAAAAAVARLSREKTQLKAQLAAMA